jgi:uncharacterized protein (TIGR02679 family)
MTVDTDRVQRLLGQDDLSWIVERARRRLERGLPLQGPVVLPGASQAQRRAVERLLGRPPASGEALTVRLESVHAILARSGAADSLDSAVQALTGSVVDRVAVRAASDRAWAEALSPLESAAIRRPVLEPWLATVRMTGLLRRLAHGDPSIGLDLAQSAIGIIERLPARALPLSVLASTVTGDGHSLDAGRPLCTLVVRAAARLGDIPEGSGAEWRRTVWASVGVLSGELTSPVLCLNLPGDPTTASGRALAVCAEAGQPVYLTARQLLHDPPTLRSLLGRSLYVCENPTVVAEAANKLGGASAPLVCASGHPAAAATVLLRMLAESGARLRYHGDFDWPGIAIANGIIGRFEAVPWRLDSSSYRAAASSGGTKLRGRAVEAIWDSDVSEAMRTIGRKIEEEQVLPTLLADIAQPD